MSTLQATNLKHGSSASNNLVLDANGNVTAAGTVAMASPFAMRNKIINGAMEIDQRNAGAAVTLSTSVQYPVDRWVATEDTDGTMTAQQSSVAPAGFINSVILTTTSADTSLTTTQNVNIRQLIEGLNVADLAWGTASARTITVSFWVRSSLTGTFGGSIRNNAFDRSYPFSYSISSANTWEYKTVTIPGDTSGTWLTTNGVGLILTFGLGAGPDRSGTSGAWAAGSFTQPTSTVSVIGTNGATFYLTGVQLEVGSVATPFERRLYPQELAMCQRYYGTYKVSFRSFCNNGDFVSNPIYYNVQMRTTPSVARSGGTFTSCNFSALENQNVGFSRYTVQATSTTMVQVIDDITTFNSEL